MLPIRDSIPRRNVPVVTWALILVNVAVFGLQIYMPENELRATLFRWGIVPARVTQPELAAAERLSAAVWLPFLTSLFLHGGLLHVFGNMWTLWIFGDNVEDRMGPLRFLGFYVFCGLVAGFVHTLSNPASAIPAIGASGAIAGVLGAYLLLFPRATVILLVPIFIYPLFFEIPAFFYLLWWFLMQVFSGTMALADPQAGGDVAWWAHVGGFLSGVLLFPLFLKRRRRRRRSMFD